MQSVGHGIVFKSIFQWLHSGSGRFQSQHLGLEVSWSASSWWTLLLQQSREQQEAAGCGALVDAAVWFCDWTQGRGATAEQAATGGLDGSVWIGSVEAPLYTGPLA